MTVRRAALILLALVALAPFVKGDEIAFTAEADKTVVALDDVVTLRVTLSGEGLDGAKPVPPDMPGFRVSFAGQSQNISFVNGRVSSDISHTYVLQPQSVGRHAIPPFTVQAGGRTYSTALIAVEVTPASGAAGTPSGPAPQDAVPGDTDGAAKDLFLTAALDKTTAYVGEPVTLTVRFHSRARLLAQPSYAPPDTTGFMTEDLPPQRQFVETAAAADGLRRRYTVVELKTALFPVAPGQATVGPASLECRTEDFSDDAAGDPFGGGFFRNFFSAGRPVVLRSAPLTLRALPLPAQGRPANFRGDVGRYGLSAALDKSTAALHEPVTLTVAVSGEGDLNALSAPVLPPLPGFKTYETLSSLNLSKAGWKISGSKVFKTILKPDVSGRLEIPRIAFSFFDPASRAYRTAAAGPLFLSVTGAGTEDGTSSPAPSNEGLKVLSRDIRYLKTGEPRRRGTPFPRSPLFLVLNLLPPVGFAALLAARAAGRRAAANPSARAARRAGVRAARAVDAARSFLKGGRTADAVDALERALRDYVADKTGRAARGLTWEDAADALTARGARKEVMEETHRLWTALQGARFSPGGLEPGEVADHARAFKTALSALEDLWKK